MQSCSEFIIFGRKFSPMYDIAPEEWAEKIQTDEQAVILDVRTPEEVEEGYIPGAIHIDFYLGQGFLDGLKELDLSKNYYVYCRSGNRSGQACAVMQNLGFTNTYNLPGGILDWEGETTT